jgi:hypothetical protein
MIRAGDNLWQCDQCGGLIQDPGDRTNRPCTLCIIKRQHMTSEPEPLGGAGTELKKLLKYLGIVPDTYCKCVKRARAMDKRGAQWCAENVEQIVGWLREEATRRKLPFVEFLARRLVQHAIRRAIAWENALAVAQVSAVLVPVVVTEEVAAAGREQHH